MPDLAESIVGADPNKFSTAGDGVSDLAKLKQSLDPLDRRAFPTGVIASLTLVGDAKEVTLKGSTASTTKQTAYVATSAGLAIVDASQFNNPIVLGQLALSGTPTDVAVDSLSNVAVVAANAGGLHFIDVSDPMLPAKFRTASVNASQVEVIDGVAYVAVDKSILAYDVRTGEQIDIQSIPNGDTITGMTHAGNLLYTMDASRSLSVFAANGVRLTFRESLQLTHGGGQISVESGSEGDVIYAAARPSFLQGGFATALYGGLSIPENPHHLVELSPSDVPDGFAFPGDVVLANGSGKALLGGTALTSPRTVAVDVMDVSDPRNTNNFLPTQIDLPASPLGLAIGSGIGYVADGSGGLQVINFLSFDIGGQAPTNLNITGPRVTGSTIDEGTLAPVRVSVTDDVQVRNVELLLNGRVVANSVSSPWDLSATIPLLSALGADRKVTLQVRATDTGGNSALSNTLTYTVTPDTTPPALLGTIPFDDGAGFRVQSVTLRFNEALDPAKLALSGVTLTNLGVDNRPGGGDDTIVPVGTAQVVGDRRAVFTLAPPLPQGRFQLSVAPTALADLAGNLPKAPVTVTFTSFDLDEKNSVAWVGTAGKGDGINWTDPLNWNTGKIPGPNDAVIINVLAPNPTIHLSSGSYTVRSLFSVEDFVMDGGSLTVTQASEAKGRFEVKNGSTLTADGPDAAFFANGPTHIDGGSFVVQKGGQIHLPNTTSYTHTSGTIVDQVVLRASGSGSVLDLSKVTSVTNGRGENDNILIEASSGGVVNLSGVTDMTDLAAGDQRNRRIEVRANGSNSKVLLGQLVNFTDASAGSTTGENRYSLLTAKGGGAIDTLMLDNLDGVRLDLDGSGTLPIGTIETLTDGRADLEGRAYAFPELTNASGSFFKISGSSASAITPKLTDLSNGGVALDGGGWDAPLLNRINGASIDVRGASTFAIAMTTAYTHTSGDIVTDQVVLRASGSGSVLDLSKVTSVTNGRGENDNILIEASSGGVVNLSGVTDMTDLAAGDQRNRRIEVKANGNTSRVMLGQLVNFTDASAGSTTGENRYSILSAQNQAQIVLNGSSTSLNGILLDVNTGGLVLGKLDIAPSSVLQGSDGTITGDVINRGIVRTGTSAGALAISGNYTQIDGGTLEAKLGRNTNGGRASLLRVGATATLAGTLQLSLFVGETPMDGDLFTVLRFDNVSGVFDSIVASGLPSGLLVEPQYNAKDLTLRAHR